ncbi:MAG: hypothetical protein KGI54_13590 [Pseudomonadota bacterium]|nr:hypothetical protein [Pseudomonadota bacterium]
MKERINDQVWVERNVQADNPNLIAVGFNPDFLDIVHQSFQILPGKTLTEIKQGDALFVLETEASVIPVKSPLSCWYGELSTMARDYPDRITDDVEVCTFFTKQPEKPKAPFRIIVGANLIEVGATRDGHRQWVLTIEPDLPVHTVAMELDRAFGMVRHHDIQVQFVVREHPPRPVTAPPMLVQDLVGAMMLSPQNTRVLDFFDATGQIRRGNPIPVNNRGFRIDLR